MREQTMSLPARLCFILIPVLGLFLSSCTLVDHSWNKLEKDTVFYLPEQPAGKKAYRIESQGKNDLLAGDYIPCTLVPYSRETSPFVHSVFGGVVGVADIREIVFCRRDDLPVRTGYVVDNRIRRHTVFSLPRRAKLVKREADEDERFSSVFWRYEVTHCEGDSPNYCGYNDLPEFPAEGRPKKIVTESLTFYNNNFVLCKSPPPSPFACEPASRRVSCPLYDRFINYPLGAVQVVTFPIVWPLHEWLWGYLRSDDE